MFFALWLNNPALYTFYIYVVFGKHTKQHNQMTYTIQICRLFLLFSLVLFPFKSYISGKPENCKLDYL